MSRELYSLAQTQVAVAVYKSSGEYHSSKRMEGEQPAGRRRVFVQTETGRVLGIELDQGDNVDTLKEKLKLALDTPPSLFLRRSSSTPCFRRSSTPHHKVLAPFGSIARVIQLFEECVKAIEMGVEPIPVKLGSGGAYIFKNSRDESVAIVKPSDEEPYAPNNPKDHTGKALGQPGGVKASVRVGETNFREVAAYLLDYDHFANVPATALVKITHSIFNVNDGVSGNNLHEKKPFSKLASFQQFIPHDFDASEYGTSSFPASAVHRIGILDIRILNTDRHAGNVLVRKLDGPGQVELIPIDHGLCLPETLEDPYFEWISWDQASNPFSDDELEYIFKLDPAKDCEMLRAELPMIREACLRVLFLCTIFLKGAAASGLCLAKIGEMMSRDFCAGQGKPSEVEVLCMEAKSLIAEPVSPLSNLEESIEEEESEGEYLQEGSAFLPNPERFPTISNLANEQLPASLSFVKLADMNEEEWARFLEKFRELLDPAFAERSPRR